MAKIINLKKDAEVTTAVERLWETGEERIYLVAPAGAALLKNVIALKLLKREANRLGKEIILVTKDEIGRELAKRAGLTCRVSLPRQAAADEEEEEVLREVPPQKFESFLQDEVKARRQGSLGRQEMSDIRPKKTAEAVLRPIRAEEPVEEELAEESIEAEQEAGGEIEEFLDEGPAIEREETAVKDFAVPAEEDDFPINKMGKSEKLEAFFNKEFFSSRRKKTAVQKTSSASWTGRFIYGLIGLTVLVSALVLYFVLPKAEIIVTPKTEAATQEVATVADKGIAKLDASQNKIPAQSISVEKKETKEFASTGERQVDEKASGKITVFNEFSSSSQALVERTRFVSEDGKVFRTARTITVPGAKIQEGKIVASSIEVEVVADQAGAEYNIGPSRFNIPGFSGTPKYDAFYGRSTAAMSGGASGLKKVVTQADFDKAKQELWETLKPTLDKEFKAQIPAGLKMLEGSFSEEIAGAESSVAVGSPADNFSLTVKGAAKAVLFDENDILELIKQKINGQLAEDKKLVSDQESLVYQNVKADFNKGLLSFKIKYNGLIVWKIKTDDLAKEVAGKKEQEIKEIFDKHSEISQAKVVFWPFWVKSVPTNLDKIKITVE